jgi:protein-tyrosine phosphatase
MKILVVCLGNICRSPMAEGILRNKISEMKLNIEVDSAGTGDYHVGECPDDRAISTAKKFGIDISKLCARQFSKADFDKFDRIYAMDSSNYKNIIRLASNDEQRKKVFHFYSSNDKGLDVPDPWYGGMDDFISVFKLLEKNSDLILEGLLKNLEKKTN